MQQNIRTFEKNVNLQKIVPREQRIGFGHFLVVVLALEKKKKKYNVGALTRWKMVNRLSQVAEKVN